MNIAMIKWEIIMIGAAVIAAFILIPVIGALAVMLVAWYREDKKQKKQRHKGEGRKL